MPPIWLFRRKWDAPVCNQVNKDFKWIIYIDRSTDGSFLEILTHLCKDLPNILHIKLADSWQSVMEQSLHSDVAKLIKPSTNALITTRLDNDDAIHKDFIQTIQQETLNFLKSNNGKDNKAAINLSKGYCLQVEPSYGFTSIIHVSNPFISLVEPLAKKEQGFLTVYHLWHNHYVTQNDFPVIQINAIPYWIQVIHSTNVANKLVGYPILDKTKLCDFGIDISKIHLSHSSYINYIIRTISYLYKRISTGITRRLKWIFPLN